MYKNQKILGIVPARGGSKGLPRKNIKELMGLPLIEFTISSARTSKHLDEVFVSTDDEEIAEVAAKVGCRPPILRPSRYAEDSSPSYEAVLHALDYFESVGRTFDYVALLEPTSPLRKIEDIDNALELLLSDPSIPSLVSVGEVRTEHPLIIKKLDASGFVFPYISEAKKIHQRQQADRAYFPYGVIYCSKVAEFRKEKTFYQDKTISYEVEGWQNFEIDDYLDFLIVEMIMKEKFKEVYCG